MFFECVINFYKIMPLRWRVALCFLAFISLIDVRQVNAKKGYGGGGHSYPKSGGYSGGGHHGSSNSGKFSGGGHGYPSPGGSHGYPSPGGSHGYPSPGGSHGYPSPGGSHGYPPGTLSGGGSGHPTGGNNGHLSGGNHGHPVSGGNTHGYPAKNPAGTTHTTTINNHYHYTPPQQIRYAPVGGGPAQSYPVYRGQPPTYVYQMKDSGSKYGTLLTGLALLNLGTLAGAAYAHSGHSNTKYTPKPGEVCLFGVKKDNGDYEETKIDCQFISSFILQEEAKAHNATNTSITTTTVTNVTMVNTTNGVAGTPASSTPAPGNPMYEKLPNGTFVPVNTTSLNATANVTTAQTNPNNTMASSVTVTTTTTNTTVTNAIDVKGQPVNVTPGMQCFVIRTTPTSKMRKSIQCGLLQTYAVTSIKKNSAVRNGPVFTILAVAVLLGFVY